MTRCSSTTRLRLLFCARHTVGCSVSGACSSHGYKDHKSPTDTPSERLLLGTRGVRSCSAALIARSSNAPGRKCRDEPAGQGQEVSESTECELCHMVVSYVRAALEDKQTAEEIEEVRSPSQ